MTGNSLLFLGQEGKAQIVKILTENLTNLAANGLTDGSGTNSKPWPPRESVHNHAKIAERVRKSVTPC